MTELSIVKKVSIGLVSFVTVLGTGYLVGRYATPAEITTIEKEKIVEVVDKESIRIAVEKREAELKEEFSKKESSATCKIVYVTKKTNPDGSIEETSVTKESSANNSETDSSTSVVEKEDKTQIETEKEVVYKTIEKDKIVIQKQYPSYGLGLSVDFDPESFDIKNYHFNFEKSIFSGVWLTLNVEADRDFYIDFDASDFGVGIGLKFVW